MAKSLGTMFTKVAAHLGARNGSNEIMSADERAVKTLGERNVENLTETLEVTENIEQVQSKGNGPSDENENQSEAINNNTYPQSSFPKEVAKVHSASNKATGNDENVSLNKAAAALSIADSGSLSSEHHSGNSTSSSTGSHSGTMTESHNKPCDTSDVNEHQLDAPKRVSIADFELLRVIGEGITAKVFLSRHKGSNRLCALKAQKKSRAGTHRILRQMLKDPEILKQLTTGQNSAGEPQPLNPFVVKLRWMFHNETYLFLAFDFYAGGDLGTMLCRYGTFTATVTRFYAVELVAALTFLHAQGIVHRDIKPENVLVDHEGHIALTDFGMATQFSTIPSYPGDEMESSITFCGSDIYVAPEVVEGSPYSFPVDWWALGTVIFEMLAGVTPFMKESEWDMFTAILEDDVVFPDDIKTDLNTTDFISGLLEKDPELRLSRFDVKEHPYFEGIEWDVACIKGYKPVHVPELDTSMPDDTQNFEKDYLDMKPVLDVEVLDKSKPAFKSAYLFNECYYNDDEQNSGYTSE